MKFLRELFSEPDGKASLSRLLTFVAVFFAMAWVTIIVRHEYKMPEFAGLSLFVGTLYGINQVSAMMGRRAAEQQKRFLDDLTAASATPAPGIPPSGTLQQPK
jgi:hypothetical protein